MLKGPKYKRGFTLRHYIDEWWDRRPHEWKVRLFVFFGFVTVIVATALLFWAHQWVERDEFMTHAKQLHEKRIQGVGSQMAAEPPTASQSLMPPSASLEVRPGE